MNVLRFVPRLQVARRLQNIPPKSALGTKRGFGTAIGAEFRKAGTQTSGISGIQERRTPSRSFSTESDIEKEIEDKLKKTIESEKILIFIKGTPEDPQCKYSAKMISILNNYKLNDYAYINVFSHELLRKCVKNVSNWPTFPQLFIRGKLIGGCDVVDQLHDSGELEKLF